MNLVETQILSDFKLRTHPFDPHIGADGNPLPQNYMELDPALDERLLNYYFDLYDWNAGMMFEGLSAQTGLKKFPEAYQLKKAEPLLILVSGAASRTGRGSLINLILYTINRCRQHSPAVIQIRFNSKNKQQNVKDMARQFISSYCPKLNISDEKKNGTRSEIIIDL